MTERTCGWCGVDIAGMKSNARYCCIQHKKNAGGRRHRERNPGYYKRYHGSPARAVWLEANKERVLAYARGQHTRYRETHPDAARQWWAANKDKHRLYSAKRRTQMRENVFLVTDKDIQRLQQRFDHCCAYCGIRPEELTLDHVIPIKRGGRHSIGNLLPACRACNCSKSARLLFPWLTQVLRQEG